MKIIDTLIQQLDKIENTKVKYENWGALFQSGGVLKVMPVDGEEEVEEVKKDDNNDRVLYDSRKYEEMLETKHEIELKKVMWSGILEWNSLERFDSHLNQLKL